MSPLALELLLEYLSRSGASLLLSLLNERIAISVSDESVHTLVAGAGAPPGKVLLPLPLQDVAAGVLRAVDSAAGPPMQDRSSALRWGVRAGGGGAGSVADVLPPALPAPSSSVTSMTRECNSIMHVAVVYPLPPVCSLS